MWRLYLLALRARMELDLGRWEDAVATTGAVLGDPRTTPVPRGWALAVLAVIRARRGEDGVHELLDEADSIVGSTGEGDRTGGGAPAPPQAALAARGTRGGWGPPPGAVPPAPGGFLPPGGRRAPPL